MFLRNVNIAVLSIRCEHPRTGLVVDAKLLKSSNQHLFLLLARQTSPIRLDYRTTCLGAGVRNRRNLKRAEALSLHRYKYSSHFFCPVISRTDSENWGGRESLSKEAGKSLTVLFCTSCSLHLHFTCGVGTFRSDIYDSVRPVLFRWHFSAWNRPGNFQNKTGRAIYV